MGTEKCDLVFGYCPTFHQHCNWENEKQVSSGSQTQRPSRQAVLQCPGPLSSHPGDFTVPLTPFRGHSGSIKRVPQSRGWVWTQLRHHLRKAMCVGNGRKGNKRRDLYPQLWPELHCHDYTPVWSFRALTARWLLSLGLELPFPQCPATLMAWPRVSPQSRHWYGQWAGKTHT